MYKFVQLRKLKNNMSERQDLEAFIKTCLQGLKTHSVKELNECVSAYLNKKEDKFSEVDFVLDSVCAEYDISKKVLINSKARGENGEISSAKKMAYCILHLCLGLTTRYLAKNVFQKWPNSISAGIMYYKRLDTKIPEHRIFKERYEKLQKKLIEHINKKNK